jgi:ketosteroid isomerase-like protein
MSERNVDLIRGTVEAFNARDIDAFVAYFDLSAELQSAFAAVGGASYRGHDGLRTYFRDFEEVWGDEIRVEPEVYFDLGEQTLGFLVMRGRGRQSGAEVAMPIAAVLRWHDGLCVHFKSYAQREDALRDLGVSEDELERIEP